jgi:steroid delta-isomerase-like uncharacterized protein
MPARGPEGKELIMSEQNKAHTKRAVEEGWNQGKLEVFDELLAPNCVFNEPSLPGGKITGPHAYKQRAQMFRAAFPDLRITVNDQFEDGDKVVLRWTVTGTHKGELMGIPPTGKHVTVTGISINVIRGDKLVEAWENSDTLGLLQQLGVVPVMAPAGPSA